MGIRSPESTGVHEAPELEDLNSPSFSVPANNRFPLATMAGTDHVVIPELAPVQEAPVSVDIRTPPPRVAAKTVSFRNAKANTALPLLFTMVQDTPLLFEK